MFRKFYLFFIVSSIVIATSFASGRENEESHSSKSSGFQPSLSFRFYSGYGSLSSGDIRKDIQSHDQYYKDRAASLQAKGYNAQTSGGHEPIKNGFGGGGEILMGFPKDALNFGAGLGFEYFKKTKKSGQDLNLNWHQGNSFHNTTRDMKENIVIAGILLKGNINYTITSQTALFADFGIGVYVAKINYDLEWKGNYAWAAYGGYIDPNGDWRYGWHTSLYGSWNQSDKFKISKNKIGFTGGLGIELTPLKSISFFGEIKGRYLNLVNVKARETYYYHKSWKYCGIYQDYDDLRYWHSNSYQEEWSSEDTLYIYDDYSISYGKTYTYVTANKDEYTKYIDYSNFRPAKIDLSGFNILFGIRIKLF